MGKLINYLPEFIRNYKELQVIMNSEQIEIDALLQTIMQILDNNFIESCDENGIEKYERIVGVFPKSNDTLEERKFRVLANWNADTPYNILYLHNKLSLLCGKDGYSVEISYATYTVTFKLALSQKKRFNDVVNAIKDSIPCNMVMITKLLYNQNNTVKQYPNIILTLFTNKEVKEEILKEILDSNCESIEKNNCNYIQTWDSRILELYGVRKDRVNGWEKRII